MVIVEGKPDLKMFRRLSLKSPSPFEESEQDAFTESGSIGKSKVSLLISRDFIFTIRGVLIYFVYRQHCPDSGI
jgi:hypothetical protein